MQKYLVIEKDREHYYYKPIVIQYDHHKFYGMYAKYNHKSGFCCTKNILFKVTAFNFEDAYKLLEEEFDRQMKLGNIKGNNIWVGHKPVKFILEDDVIIED